MLRTIASSAYDFGRFSSGIGWDSRRPMTDDIIILSIGFAVARHDLKHGVSFMRLAKLTEQRNKLIDSSGAICTSCSCTVGTQISLSFHLHRVTDVTKPSLGCQLMRRARRRWCQRSCQAVDWGSEPAPLRRTCNQVPSPPTTSRCPLQAVADDTTKRPLLVGTATLHVVSSVYFVLRKQVRWTRPSVVNVQRYKLNIGLFSPI